MAPLVAARGRRGEMGAAVCSSAREPKEREREEREREWARELERRMCTFFRTRRLDSRIRFASKLRHT